MTLWGVVVAAGAGRRFGGAKHGAVLHGVPLYEWARSCLMDAGCAGVVVVGDVVGGIPGGVRRRDSVAAGLAALPEDADMVLVHDAARPLASPNLATAVVNRLRRGDVDGVVPIVPVRDTLKQVAGDRVVNTVDRERLGAVQTPQGFRLEALRAAHAADDADATDDAALIERTGGAVAIVEGEPSNLKVTYRDDLEVAAALHAGGRGRGFRVGHGFDAHRFAVPAMPGRPLKLLGIVVDDSSSLAGTSDADVAAHAVADAILGAAALGDLGVHFPSADPAWEGADSMAILSRVVEMAGLAGYAVVNVDVTVIAQSTRVGPHRREMRDRLASVLQVGAEAVSVKATTTDTMGFTGRDEGIAAAAVVVVSG